MATLEERKDSMGTWYVFGDGEYYTEPLTFGGWAVYHVDFGHLRNYNTLDEIRNTY